MVNDEARMTKQIPITGESVAFLRFSSSVQEIFAVQVLPVRWPELFHENHESIDGAFFLPPEALAGQRRERQGVTVLNGTTRARIVGRPPRLPTQAGRPRYNFS
jgi:hypothetical protein